MPNTDLGDDGLLVAPLMPGIVHSSSTTIVAQGPRNYRLCLAGVAQEPPETPRTVSFPVVH
jgi:hypothetical protein